MIQPFIAVDFDGTVVEHEYPRIGNTIPLALESLKLFQERGARLLLWTMRDGNELDDAVFFMRRNDIKLFGVNENPSQKHWTKSPKAYAHVYIDDAAAGCPLIVPECGVRRPYVDWSIVQPYILRKFGMES